MKKLALGALMIGLLAACGGDDGGDDVSLIDAGPDVDAEPAACNPVSNTGCDPGLKCTWIQIVDRNPETGDPGLGKVGCVADGTVAVGGECTRGPAGETTGFDDCVGGSFCLSGVCAPICGTTPDTCDPATSACSKYQNLFDDTTGVCDFLCSPSSQTRKYDNAADCGSTDTRAKGCYGFSWYTLFTDGTEIPHTCAPEVYPDLGLGDEAGPALNGCAAGFGSFLNNFTAEAIWICVAYCQPGIAYQGNVGQIAGDPASGHACSDRGDVATTTECRYLHTFDGTPDVAQNDSGMCINPNAYLLNWDGNDATPDTGLFSCANLTQNDYIAPNGTDTNIPEYVYWGCGPWDEAYNAFAPGLNDRQRINGLVMENVRAFAPAKRAD